MPRSALPSPAAPGWRSARGVGLALLQLAANLTVTVSRAVAQVVPGGLGTRVNGTALGGCDKGVCGVKGGTAVGRTLFHRFSRFDSRRGIRQVDLDTRGRANVVVGVSDPMGTFFGAPLHLSDAASLFWLSPGGIWLGSGGQIVGATNLLLSTAPTLRLGGGEFRAAGGLGDPPGELGDASSLDLERLARGGLQGVGLGTGPIVLAGGRLRVDRHLLLDSGAGPIRGLPGARHDLRAGGDVRLTGGELQLRGLDVQGGTAEADGGVWLRAGAGQGRLELADSALRGPRLALEGGSTRLDTVRLEGGDVLVRANGPLTASRLRVSAGQPGVPGAIWLTTLPGPGGSASPIGLEAARLSGDAVSVAAAGDLSVRELSAEGETLHLRAAGQLALEGSQLQATGERGRIQLEALSAAGEPARGRLELRSSHLSGQTIVGVADQALSLREVSAVAGEPGRRGLVRLETAPAAEPPAGPGPGASGQLTLAAARLEGQRVQLRGGAIQLTGSQVVAPKGLIHLEAAAGDLDLAASRLDVGATTLADLRADLPRFAVPADSSAPVFITVSAVPTIGLFAAGQLDIRDGSAVLASQDVDALRQANPALRRDDLRLTDTSGLVVADGGRGVRVRDSRIAADATDNLAGNVILRSQGGPAAETLTLTNAWLSASGGAGSGDIRLNSANGLRLLGSRLLALSSRPREEAGQPGQPSLRGGFSGGEITLTNSSTTRPIQVIQSQLNAEQGLHGPPLPATSLLANANGIAFADPYDDFDNGNVYTGGVISLLSAGGIHLSGEQTALNVGMASAEHPSVETIAGTLRLANLSSRPLRIDNGARLNATSNASPDSAAGAAGARGQINLWSRGPVLMHKATLDASTVTSPPQAARANPSAPASLAILSASSASLRDSTLLFADPAAAPRLRLESRGRLTITNTTMSSSCPGAACEQAPWSAARFNRFLRGDFWGARQAENYYLLPQGNQIQDQVVSGGDFFTAGGLVGLTRASRLREPATLLFIGDQPPLSLSRLTPVAGRLPPSGNVDTSRSPSAREPRDIAWPPTGDPALAPRFPVAQVLAANAPAPNLAELNPLAESPRLLSTAEAEQIVRDVQRRSGEQVMAALGLADRGQGVREVAILQQALRRAMPPETGAPPGPTAKPPYRPAILQISVTALPDRSLAQINQVLIPPSGEIRGWQTRVNERALKQAIQRFQRQLSELAEPEPGGAADQLTALLLKPVLPALQAQGITGLLLSLDRGLQGIPFAALPLATGTLGDRVALTVTPALALTELAPSPHSRPGRTLLAGASVFGNGLAPLPMARQELNQLARLHPDSLVLLDGRFQTRTLLEAALAQPMDILHMATHADFNGQRESAARIYTSDGEFSLADLAKRWRNSSSPAIALFVLNACRTAVGNEERELGIAGLALQAGASSALGNLWYVDDVVTAAFSIQFHRWLHKGLRKDQALQETQRQFRRGDIRVVGDQILVGGEEVLITGLNRGQQLQLAHAISHPYYWAGVVLSGSPW